MSENFKADSIGAGLSQTVSVGRCGENTARQSCEPVTQKFGRGTVPTYGCGIVLLRTTVLTHTTEYTIYRDTVLGRRVRDSTSMGATRGRGLGI